MFAQDGGGCAVRAWATRWIDRLATLQRRPRTLHTADDRLTIAGRVEAFARTQDMLAALRQPPA